MSATATVSDQQLENLPLRTQKFTEALSMSPSVIRTQEGKLNFNGQAESQGMLLVDSAENVDRCPEVSDSPVRECNSKHSGLQHSGQFRLRRISGGLTKIEIKPPIRNGITNFWT